MRLKELLLLSINHLSELTDVTNPDFRLEQAVFDEKDNSWEVVVSFLVPEIDKDTFISGFKVYHSPVQRVYKKIRFDKDLNFKGFFIFNQKE